VKVMTGINELSAASTGSAVTIGTFDGVHLGHRALIARTIRRARERGLRSVVVTWDRHPNVTLRPAYVPPLLTGERRKLELLEETAVDAVALVAFDEELSRLTPETFAARVLSEGLGAGAVVVGAGWRFGHRAAGDVALLEKLGTDLGFTAEGLNLESVAGGPVSSSRARAAVTGGEVELARTLLGRPYDLDGEVIRGDGRGASLGYPTANLDVAHALARPALGIYAGRARVGDEWHGAAISVGTNPQFQQGAPRAPRVEAFLLDFSGDLYGEALRIELWARLREERRFDSVEALVAQMDSDVEATRSLTC